MLPSMVQLGASFSAINPAWTGTGMLLRASQKPCSTTVGNAAVDGPPSQCCSGSVCAAWAGAHLVSQGCILYGVFELEAAFQMSTVNAAGLAPGAFYFTAMYLVKSGDPAYDPSWNEIDIGMIVGPRGLEYHTTMFTAAPDRPTTTTMDALTFDVTGPVVTSGGGVKSSDGSSAGSPLPFPSNHSVGKTNKMAFFGDAFAADFHTYKVVWTPGWTAWLVDMTMYRNITYSIWRPQSIRQILRTNVGDSADAAPATPWCANAAGDGGTVGKMQCVSYNAARPDAYVAVKRIRYTPLDAANPWATINDATRCRGMAYAPCSRVVPVAAGWNATASRTLTT